MLVHPRVALASGLAAAAAATLIVTGRIEGSIVTVLALAVAARAAAPAASTSPEAPAALARQVAAVPAWVAVAVTAVMRIESASIGSLLGANAIAGSPLVRGEAPVVAGAWVALIAGTMAIVSGFGATRMIVGEAPFATLEIIGAAVQVVLLAALFAGPQVAELTDAIPWAIAIMAIAGAVVVARDFARRPWIPRAAAALGIVALVLTWLGSPP